MGVPLGPSIQDLSILNDIEDTHRSLHMKSSQWKSTEPNLPILGQTYTCRTVPAMA